MVSFRGNVENHTNFINVDHSVVRNGVATDICSNELYSDIIWSYKDFNNGSADRRNSHTGRKIDLSVNALFVDKKLFTRFQWTFWELRLAFQNCSTRPSINTINETDNECNGPDHERTLDQLKSSRKQRRSDGSALSIEMLNHPWLTLKYPYLTTNRWETTHGTTSPLVDLILNVGC